MADNCCQVTEDGAMSCSIAEHENGCSCAEKPAVITPEEIPVRQRESFWHKIRGGVMFGIACIASPCCSPLIVPVMLVMLAGTPAAVWLNAHIGSVYALLTLLSVVSFVLALRWSRIKHAAPKNPAAQPDISVPKSTIQIKLS